MDKLETRLKQDAAGIQAETSTELRTRIDASLHAAREQRSTAYERPARATTSWWVSSVTGLTAAVLVIALFNWNRSAEQEVAAPAETLVSSQTPTDTVSLPQEWLGGDGLLLNVESADLTRSLEEELLNLQSDLEKARENVERDVKFAF